ncbi:aldo/keto reductase-like protein [Bisporella sp. PMI_857]|nr:aldo/keto reductase-like protein [Bisporella sp. PMI_857]
MPSNTPRNERIAPQAVNKTSAKVAHVNMMTDTIIANMPPDGLRKILRGLLGVDPKVTMKLNELAKNYLSETTPDSSPELFKYEPYPSVTSAFSEFQRRYRCLMGCGLGFASIDLLVEVIRQVQPVLFLEGKEITELLMDTLAVVDADIVQSVTAVQKELQTASGIREMNNQEEAIVNGLRDLLVECKHYAERTGRDFVFDRGFSRIMKLKGISGPAVMPKEPAVALKTLSPTRSGRGNIEYFQLGSLSVPRMFMGLWQFSSPAWGTASTSKINKDFRKHVDAGFTAYDMSDHYGDAEVVFGSFRSSQSDALSIFCATKYCVFEPITITKDVVEANISERLLNINASTVELLQLHWQFYDDLQYVKMAQLVKQDTRVLNVGLCNFDTQRMNEVVESGVQIVSNQVQFSLIDLRPTFKMAESCLNNNIKLLTYGSLCGGFLAEKWLNKSAPNMFAEDMTPSHRKYFEMITVWGGWGLLQQLLGVLFEIGQKYNVSVSNVATRWVLDHEYVGAVIIGGRMGISEHVDENLKVFSFKIDEEDKAKITVILEQSRAQDMFDAIGDCGAEYR